MTESNELSVGQEQLRNEIRRGLFWLNKAKRGPAQSIEQAQQDQTEFHRNVLAPTAKDKFPTYRELLNQKLKHFQDRKAELEVEIALEEQYHAAHPEEYFMPLEEVPFYAGWRAELRMVEVMLRLYYEELRKLHRRPSSI